MSTNRDRSGRLRTLDQKESEADHTDCLSKGMGFGATALLTEDGWIPTVCTLESESLLIQYGVHALLTKTGHR